MFRFPTEEVPHDFNVNNLTVLYPPVFAIQLDYYHGNYLFSTIDKIKVVTTEMINLSRINKSTHTM